MRKELINAQAKVEIALENYWKLRALDLPAKEYQMVVNKPIENKDMQSMLTQCILIFSRKHFIEMFSEFRVKAAGVIRHTLRISLPVI